MNSTNPPKMKIYDFPRGPYPARIRIALAEKNLQSLVRFELIDLYEGAHKTPEFTTTKNFSGTVPVLELEDGTLIAECTAITEYLDALDGNQILTGRTPRERGLIHMMNRRAELEVLDAISLYFHHATPGLGPRVETDQNPEWGTRQRTKALRGMRYFDARLTTQPFLVGPTFTMADITLIAGLIFADAVELDIPTDCHALRAWRTTTLNRPSVQNRVTMSEPTL